MYSLICIARTSEILSGGTDKIHFPDSDMEAVTTGSWLLHPRRFRRGAHIDPMSDMCLPRRSHGARLVAENGMCDLFDDLICLCIDSASSVRRSHMAQDWCLSYGVCGAADAEILYKTVCKRKGVQPSSSAPPLSNSPPQKVSITFLLLYLVLWFRRYMFSQAFSRVGSLLAGQIASG